MDMAPMGASPLESLADLLPSYTASVFLECMLFGAYAVTFFMGAWSLLHMSYMGRPSKRDLIILGVNATMFALALSYGTLERVSDGLYKASNMTSHLGAARFCIYVTQTLICDTFMIYRAFVIWERQWKIIALPLILLILDAISGYLSTTPKGDNLTMMILFPCASFLTNSLSTALIMWRVLAGGGANTAQVARFTLYRRVITAIVQSAAVYSVASITLLVTVSVSPDSAYATCLTMFPPFIGLIFSLVVLRLARRSAASDAPSAADSRPLWYERERERGRGPALLPITAEGARASHCFQAPAIHLPPLAAYGGGDAQNPGARMLVIEKGSDDGCEGYNMEESPRFSGAVRDTSAERSSSAGSFERRDSKHEST
ncbi:hypothetical protein TRAPUB_2140 [Trametes pubescens]|uniref:Uncharacterized protein n=1 Tax=Trametes pubescens TaxID=154538 RepID=A0A1M2VHE4_TRAPU|nr:hypothetical protein TRAPUB_2140 [Trametes pubescens]